MHSHMDPPVSHSPHHNIFVGFCLQALSFENSSPKWLMQKPVFMQGQILTVAEAVIHTLRFTSSVYTHSIQPIKPVLVPKH